MKDLHYGSSVYNTARDLAYAMIYDFLSAEGVNDVAEILAENSDSDLIAEMWANEWTHDAVDKDLAADVLEDIRKEEAGDDD